MRLDEHRRRRRDEDEAGDAFAPMPREIPDRLAGRHRMGDERQTRKIGVVGEGGDVVGESVEVVAAGRLIGAAVASAIEADAAEALIRECGDLVVPHSTAAAEAIQEQDLRARSPLTPIKLSAVFRCDERHGNCPRCEGGWEALGGSEWMVDQDPPVAVDDEKL